jgi:glycosyltransferase involved in cell wall biosynthesis
VGMGPQEGYLRKMIDSLDERMPGTTHRMRIQPRVDDLGNFYSALDAFALPSSDHDPFGLVAAEAMSMGIPTIVTDECGIAGYLENGNDALIVKAGEAADLRAGIQTLLDDATRVRIGDTGKVTAEQKFSVERMVREYEKLLHTDAAAT